MSDAPTRDWLSAEGAQALAAQLDTHWAKSGHKNVRHWTEQVSVGGGRHTRIIFAVRSNLIGGLPPTINTTGA